MSEAATTITAGRAVVSRSQNTMRALVLERPGEISFREISVPEPGPGEILIQVKAATTCGTDLKAYLRGHQEIPMPGVFGHEYSGVVAAAGIGAKFHEGDEVMGVHSAPCRECKWCRQGQENLCETLMATKVLGSYAEYLLIPERIASINLFPKPVGLSFDQASLLEPLSCVLQAMRNLNGKPFENALVIGPGAIGLMFVAALRKRGVPEITLAGRNPRRLEIGRKLGAIPAFLADLPEEPEFDLVVECTGAVEIWERSLGHARRGGTVMLFGGCPSGSHVAFATRRVHYDQIDLISPFHFGTEAVQQAREHLLDPSFDLAPILSGERTLEDGQQVFEDLKAGSGVKYVFRP